MRILHLPCQILRILSRIDQPHLIPEPLDRCSGHKNRPLQRIIHLSVQSPGNGGDQPVSGEYRLFSGVHQHEAAGAVSILGHAVFHAQVPEQGRLLVAGDARDGDARAALAADVGLAIDRGGGLDFGQHGTRDAQHGQDVFVPCQLVDVEKHGARGIGVVGHMHAALGHVPDQPGVDGPEQQLPLLRLFTGAGHIVQDPLDLGAGEIGVQQQAGIFPHVFLKAFVLAQFVADLRGAAALPDDGVVHGLARILLPDHRGLALVGDADGGHLVRRDAHTGQGFGQRGTLGGPDLAGIMLHPARTGIDLGKFALHHSHDIDVLIQHDGAGAGGTLVQGDDIFALHSSSPVMFKGDRQAPACPAG